MDTEINELRKFKARNIICLNLADSVLIHVDTESSPKEIWAKFEEIYDQKTWKINFF